MSIEELRDRPVPTWFEDAKFGIFVHWGLYSVPAWAEVGLAPTEHGEFGAADGFLHNTYAEWYLNSISIEGTAAHRHHLDTYGGAPYDDFAPVFKAASRRWNPGTWASLFASAGARYVVMGTKHHDGFLMWPSDTPNPHKPGWQSDRDLVGELTEAVREAGLEMGLYYSGGIDWTFQGLPIKDMGSFVGAIPERDDYAAYADAHWRELIDRYDPMVLWNDIHYPRAADAHGLFADYYERVPDGVVNNRFDFIGVNAGTAHADFLTPEYSTMDTISAKKWETCRGIGKSFGLNRAETDADRLSADEIVHLLVDVVSKNGNLLLNVGPAADGDIPFEQASRLAAVGRWLAVNGDAIYGTRPWTRASGRTSAGQEVRFTAGANRLVYAIVLGPINESKVTIEGLGGRRAWRLGDVTQLAATADEVGLTIDLVDVPGSSPATAFAVEGAD